MLTFWQKNKRRLICLISSSSSAHAQKKQCSGISVVDQRNGGTSEKQSTVVRRSSGGVTALTKSGLTTPYLKDKRNYYGINECWRYFIMNESKMKKLSMFQRREIGVFRLVDIRWMSD